MQKFFISSDITTFLDKAGLLESPSTEACDVAHAGTGGPDDSVLKGGGT